VGVVEALAIKKKNDAVFSHSPISFCSPLRAMPSLASLAAAALFPQPPEPLRLDNLASAAGRAVAAAAVALEAGAAGILVTHSRRAAGRADHILELCDGRLRPLPGPAC
jgi:hypothetical protein